MASFPETGKTRESVGQTKPIGSKFTATQLSSKTWGGANYIHRSVSPEEQKRIDDLVKFLEEKYDLQGLP